jgi:hypothetical protein
MIITQETFVCKPGNASKFAKMMKKMAELDKRTLHVLTDLTGQFNRVVIINQYQDWADYQKAWDEYKNPSPEMQEAMKGMEKYTEMYLTGSREIYQTW